MSTKQWVCHISGQGEKWEVIEWDDKCWRTEKGTGEHCNKYFLPKSEYRPCDPPEVWERVECDIQKGSHYGVECTEEGLCVAVVQLSNRHSYRVVSVVLEKKVTQ